MARIRIYIGRHLCTAPRAQKEAEALASVGHKVSVHGLAYRSDYSQRDANLMAGRNWSWSPVADFSRPARRLSWLLARLRHRLSREWYTYTGRVLADVWGYANHALAAHARRDPADLTIVHAEGGLWFAEKLLCTGHRIGVDFEDWFSRDLTPAQRTGRPVNELAQLERRLLQATPYVFTTSHALAQAMATELGAPAPAVIHNTFPLGPTPPEPIAVAEDQPVRLHWFSLVLGPERGLENLFTALPTVKGRWELHLRGDSTPTYRHRLLALLPESLRAQISFHSTVEARQLPTVLQTYDIGLALEVSAIPSRNLTITNKFFHYLQAGLAIVASDTAGHREALALAPGAGIVFAPGDPAALSTALNQLCTDPVRLLACRHHAAESFRTRAAHEHQSGLYAERAALALAAPAPRPCV